LQARRREDDISIVTSALRVKLAYNATPANGTPANGTPANGTPANGSGWTVSDATLAFGGLRATTCLAPLTAAALVGKNWDAKQLDGACKAVLEELRVSPGEAVYRE